MKLFRVTGILLIVLGLVMIVTGGFSFKQKKKVVDTEVVDISRTETKTVLWSPLTGGIVILGGIILLMIGGKRNE